MLLNSSAFDFFSEKIMGNYGNKILNTSKDFHYILRLKYNFHEKNEEILR